MAAMRISFLRDPVHVDGFLTVFRGVITEFGDAIPKLDRDISKFKDVLKVFRGFTAELGVFISDVLEDMDEFVRILSEFDGLVTEFSDLVTELGKVISKLNDQGTPDIETVLADYYNDVGEFNVVLAELEFDGDITDLDGDGSNDYVPPRVSPASSEKIERLEKVRVTNEETCSICLDVLSVGSEASRLRCSHNFHGHCIANWLKASEICPYCRSESPC